MKGHNTNQSKTNPANGTEIVRCAIYARCASDVPTEHSSSLAEQIRACTDYAQKQGWEAVGEFVQSDIGASGVSLIGCKSLLQLVDAAAREPRPFDCVLIADISRLGRSMDRVFKFLHALHAHGVFVQAAHGNFDSRNFRPGAWAAKHFLDCIPQYLQPRGQQCPTCAR